MAIYFISISRIIEFGEEKNIPLKYFNILNLPFQVFCFYIFRKYYLFRKMIKNTRIVLHGISHDVEGREEQFKVFGSWVRNEHPNVNQGISCAGLHSFNHPRAEVGILKKNILKNQLLDFSSLFSSKLSRFWVWKKNPIESSYFSKLPFLPEQRYDWIWLLWSKPRRTRPEAHRWRSKSHWKCLKSEIKNILNYR